jgi:glycosyltransferase involved in cell wall biosynthesis
MDMEKTDPESAGQLRFSVVIPCLNAAKYIGTTLFSLVQQRYRNLEVIIVDGGSVDKTVEIARGFTELDLKIMSESDHGQLDAVQKGFGIATGNIFHWLNADDIAMPNSLEYVNKTFLGSPEIDLVFSDNFAFDEDRAKFGVGATIRRLTYLEHLLFYRQMYSECVFWRSDKTKLLPESYFHLRLCTDYAFFINLRFGLREKWVPKRLGAFRMVAGQVSKRYIDRLAAEREFIRGQIYANHGWTAREVRLRRLALAPEFFIFQYLYPRLDSALRKIRRILTRDARRKAMTAEFFGVWLGQNTGHGDVDAVLLER